MVVRGGASAAQDGRFIKNKMKKDMAAFSAPPEYSLAVDFKKICWEVLEGWIMQRVTELLRGVEDEVLVGTILESLKAKDGTKPKDLHHELVPFLANNTTLFVKELWAMLHSASNNATGVPDQLQQKHLEEQRKKSEQQALIQARIEEARRRQSAAANETASRPRERELQKQPRDSRSDRDRPPHQERDSRDSRHDDRRADRRMHDTHARDYHRRRERDLDRRDYRAPDGVEYDRRAADSRKHDRRPPDGRYREWEENDRRGGRPRDRDRERAPESDSRQLRRQDAVRHREGPRDDDGTEREDGVRKGRDEGGRALRRQDAITVRDRMDRDVPRREKEDDSRADGAGSPRLARQRSNGRDKSPGNDADVKGDDGRELRRSDAFRWRDVDNSNENGQETAGDIDVQVPGERSAGDRRQRDVTDSPVRAEARREPRRREGSRDRSAPDDSRGVPDDGGSDMRGGSKHEREDGARGRGKTCSGSEEHGAEHEMHVQSPQDALDRHHSDDRVHSDEDPQNDEGGERARAKYSGASRSRDEKHGRDGGTAKVRWQLSDIREDMAADGQDYKGSREDWHERDSSRSKSKKRKAEKSEKEKKSKKSKKHKHRDREYASDRERSPAARGSSRDRNRVRSPDGGKSDVEVIESDPQVDLEALRQEARQAQASVRAKSLEEQG